MLITSKLFIWHWSGIESAEKGATIKKAEQWLAGKGSMRECHLCAIFKLYTNSFCRQRAGLEVLIKVTSKADREKKSVKVLQKKCFVFFPVVKNVFHNMFAKFSYLIWPRAISSPQSLILRCTDMSCLCNIGTCSKLRDVSWLLWSLHLVVNIVKTMW